jgi:hypothetical protein
VIGGDPAFVMAIELGSPRVLIGEPFTTVFAVCKECVQTGDLSAGWRVLDLSHIYVKSRYSACPTLRHFDGWFYLSRASLSLSAHLH